MPKVTVKGLPDTIEGLRKFKQELHTPVENAIGKRLESVVKDAQNYPPPLPSQKYKRTYTFRGSWALRKNGMMSFIVQNTAIQKGRYYAHYVMGDGDGKGQAKIHKGRWRVFRKDIEKTLAPLMKDIDLSIQNLASKKGL